MNDHFLAGFIKRAEEFFDDADLWNKKTNTFHTVHVPLIHKHVEGRRAKEIPISQVWGGSPTSPGFLESRVDKADTSYPIILDNYTEGNGYYGGLVDGRHRTIKLLRQGADKVNAIRLSQKDVEALIAANEKLKQRI